MHYEKNLITNPALEEILPSLSLPDAQHLMFHCSWKHRCLSALRPPLPWSYSIWPRLPHHVTCFFQTPVTIFTLTEWIIPVFLYFPCIRFSALPIILPFYPPSIWHLHAKRVIITPANTKPCFIPSKLPCFLLKVVSCSATANIASEWYFCHWV